VYSEVNTPQTIDASGISGPPWSYGVPPASSILSLTQDTLSQLLGVRRTTVTQEVAKLLAWGPDRRGLIEVDRGRLEQASCECYDVMRGQTDQIASRPRPHIASDDDICQRPKQFR